MSRIGYKHITIPAGVKVSVEGQECVVAGKLGTLRVPIQKNIAVAVEGDQIAVTRTVEDMATKALHGLVRAMINNAVIGVVDGYKKALEIHGVGFKAELQGKKLVLALGFSHKIEYIVPDGVKCTVTDGGINIAVEGCDKQLVGEVAASIRRFRPPEPYKGKGVRYADEHVTIKPGKTNA